MPMLIVLTARHVSYSEGLMKTNGNIVPYTERMCGLHFLLAAVSTRSLHFFKGPRWDSVVYSCAGH